MKYNKLTRTLFLVSALALSTQNSYAQFSNIFNKKGSTSNSSTISSNLSTTDIAAGLKDALKIGAQNASNKLSVTNGFLGNQAIKILMPPEVAKVEKALRGAGMGKIVDEAVTKLNRAAEDAAKSAAPIFVNAITSMSITDAVGIFKGGDNAATNYLQRVTTSSLTAAFRPTINNSLNKVGAADAWNKVFTNYNKLPFTKKVNSDLASYVTEKALYGMFYTIAQEEAKIRKDPAAQVTSILEKVFGNKK